MLKELNKDLNISIIGLGYVGLPLAIAFGKKYSVTGFDTSKERIDELHMFNDHTGEIDSATLKESNITFTNTPQLISNSDVIIITVPTPIDKDKTPDLSNVTQASETVGRFLPKTKQSIVVFESTVYPGVTEDICCPILQKYSKLRLNDQFFIGYSPERLSPGDPNRTLDTIVKIVSGSTQEACQFLSDLYASIIPAGIHKASSIKVAEAAKVIENTQRDLNVALMNELAIIFNKMGIPTLDVIDAASTKWNFMAMTPGLVGGHCIGVDPYYLTFKSKELGYHPQVILAGRQINDSMSTYIAEQTTKQLTKANKQIRGSTILIMGVAFKENVSDIRNTKIIDITTELSKHGVRCILVDPMVNESDMSREYNLSLESFDAVKNIDGVIIAVPHRSFISISLNEIASKISGHDKQKVILDVKGIYRHSVDTDRYLYWVL